jgi:hypothetical protein
MILDQAAQIMAQIRSGKMINIRRQTSDRSHARQIL